MQARPWKRLAVTFLHWPWSTKTPMQTTNAGVSTENRACFKCTWELENQTSNSDVQSCHLSQRFVHFFSIFWWYYVLQMMRYLDFLQFIHWWALFCFSKMCRCVCFFADWWTSPHLYFWEAPPLGFGLVRFANQCILLFIYKHISPTFFGIGVVIWDVIWNWIASKTSNIYNLE